MAASAYGERRRKLLLIDDDEAVLDFLRVKLGGEFDLIATGSADKVLALVREGRPDLVLCDIDLQSDSDGMDGGDISVALFSHEDTRHIPLVFLTALASPSDLKASGNQLGGRAAISKQSPIEDIISRIRASLAP
jgi:putative two-component system response regulator